MNTFKNLGRESLFFRKDQLEIISKSPSRALLKGDNFSDGEEDEELNGGDSGQNLCLELGKLVKESVI